MPQKFFRFPHTPHLAWLGEGEPRDDKVLSVVEARELLAGEVTVEEKLDGANLGFSLDSTGHLLAQNRGSYLIEPFSGQFSRLANWLAQHAEALTSALAGNLMFFGEWCTARHSLSYDHLPDWFLMFDVYDRCQNRFWSSVRRDALVDQLGLSHVPKLAFGRMTLSQIQQELVRQPSRYRDGPMEGVIVRRETAQWCEERAKLVNSDFTQAIDDHWRRRALQWNRVTWPADCEGMER